MKDSEPETLGHNYRFFYFCGGHYGAIIMARPVSITKDKILAAALNIVRKGGPEALTSRSLSTALGCGANALFTSFGHGDKDGFSYSIAELPADRKTDFLNICTEMKKNGWISYTQNKSKTELLVTSSIPKKNKSFLNGGWAENVNRYLVNKVLTDYSANHKKTIKYRVFWDVKLKLLESEKDNLNDMQLDIVVQINDRFYVFETKSGTLGIQKWVERAEIFNRDGNRFLTCCIDYSSVDPKLFQPYSLLSLEHLEEQLIELLDLDFPQSDA